MAKVEIIKVTNSNNREYYQVRKWSWFHLSYQYLNFYHRRRDFNWTFNNDYDTCIFHSNVEARKAFNMYKNKALSPNIEVLETFKL